MLAFRALVRLAVRLHAVYERRRASPGLLDFHRLEGIFREAKRLHRLVKKAHKSNLKRAATTHRYRLTRAIEACVRTATQLHEQCLDTPCAIPTVEDLLAELRCLFAEFDDVFVDMRQKWIAIQTDEIVLEEINLGRFLVRLRWPRLGDRANVDSFEIVALDPNPASSDESVTHPHVKSQHLCAGDATLPVQKALEQGRLVDAFSLVFGVLTTYNSGSPYVALTDWNGLSCWSCCGEIRADDRYACDACDHDFCDCCTSSCSFCDNIRCASCQTRCDVCEDPCCRGCLETSACSKLQCCPMCLKNCAGCKNSVASNELDKALRCPSCRAKSTDHQQNISEISSPS